MLLDKTGKIQGCGDVLVEKIHKPHTHIVNHSLHLPLQESGEFIVPSFLGAPEGTLSFSVILGIKKIAQGRLRSLSREQLLGLDPLTASALR
jgi:hypothetical protein